MSARPSWPPAPRMAAFIGIPVGPSSNLLVARCASWSPAVPASSVRATSGRSSQDGTRPFADAEVVVLDLLTYAGTLTNLAPVLDSPRLRFVQGDIRDAELVAELMAGVDVVVHFAAESHVDRSIARRGRLRLDERGRHPGAAAGRARGRGRPVRARVDRRGVRLDRAGLVAGDPPAGAELAVLGVEGGLGPAGPGLPPHARPAGVHHALLEQLRAAPVPGEGDPAVRDEPARRAPGAALRRRAQRPRLAARRRPLPRDPARRGAGAARARSTTSAAAPS